MVGVFGGCCLYVRDIMRLKDREHNIFIESVHFESIEFMSEASSFICESTLLKSCTTSHSD